MPAIKSIETVKQDKVKKVVSKKLFGKQKPQKPLKAAKGWPGVDAICKAVGDVIFIIPVVLAGCCEMISRGFLAGLEKTLAIYKEHVGK